MEHLHSISKFLPYLIGVGFILIGFLVTALPTPSLLRLDKSINAWVHDARTPFFRMQIVVASYKALGGFLGISGLIYILLSLEGIARM